MIKWTYEPVSDSGEDLISGVLHIDPLCGLNPSEASWLKVQTVEKKKPQSDIEAGDGKKPQGEGREDGGRAEQEPSVWRI